MDLFVTADDFGMSPSINRAVAQSMALGYASHTSVLATGKDFEEACQFAREYSFEDRVGLHFNLTWGAPVTEPMRRNSRFCREGLFTPLTRARMLAPILGEERRIIADEARAQLKRARKYGLATLHLDSHNHYHISPNLATILVRVAKEPRIRRVRLARNCIPGTSMVSRLFKAAYKPLAPPSRSDTDPALWHSRELVWLVDRGWLRGPAE